MRTHGVQVIVSEEEREAFRRRAAAAGTSLSSWLRDAARQQLERDHGGVLADAGTARRFFAQLPDEGAEPEPDREEQRAVLAAARAAGLPTT